MPILNIYAGFLELLRWPYRFILTKFLIPFLARREVRRKGVLNSRAVTFKTFLSTPVVIKIKAVDQIRREVKTLQFVAKTTTIPVPQVYGEWIEPTPLEDLPELGCMVMERLPGVSLRPLWRKLSEEQKQHIFRQLRPYLEELRRIPQPPPVGRIESLIGVCYDQRLSRYPFGPFRNEEEFHDWRISTHDWQVKGYPPLATFFRKSREALRDDHRIVFTHGDLHIQNVQVDIRGPEPEDACVVALLDWEMAAWMPEYWEPIKMCQGQTDKDWLRMIPEMFPGYDTEIETDRQLLEASGRPC